MSTPTTTRERQEHLQTRLLLALALLSATAPISCDLYLASFPEIGRGLHTSASSVQLTLTAFLVGLALGQVAWGPVTDRYGRRTPLLVGSVVAALAAVGTVVAPTVGILIACRLVQALFAAGSMVIARAVLADLTRGYAGVHAFSLMTTIQGVAPVAAPIVGGILAGRVPWRGVLGVVLAVMVLQLLAAVTTVPETLPREQRSPRMSYADIGRVLRRPAFLAYVGTQAFTFGVLMGFVSSSSFLYQTVIGTSGLVYGIGFAINASAMLVTGVISARLARRKVHPGATVSRALPVLVIASVMVLVVALLPVTPWLIPVPVLVAFGAIGLITGNSAALAVAQARPIVGAGSATMGGLMFLVGGLVSPLGGIAGAGTAVPLGIVMTCSATLALISFTYARRHVARHPHLEAELATTGS